MRDEELKQTLIQANLLSQEELEKASDETKKLKRPLEKVISDMHLLDKDALYGAIAQKIGVEYKSLIGFKVDDELLKTYSEDLARNTQSLPLVIQNNFLHIAMHDPGNVSFIDQIQLFTGYPLEVYLSCPDDIDDAINKAYAKDEASGIFTDFKTEPGLTSGDATSIVKIVDLVVAQAVRDRASDIHIEPEESSTRIRFRIDGVLHEIPPPPKEWELSIISRIKVLAGMDIAESRVPQDGHFQAKIDEKIVDFRVSTLPTIYGENVVMRLLDTASVTIGLERLGFTTYDDLERYEKLLARPYGILLSTGPTGSGKTTTLYSALMRINTPDRNIITLEDPVEYRLGLIRQVQINPKAGITFSNGMRAVLRQDPDVLMVGEIRDLETARLAVQAALTGHLVFSTLHTNDAPSAVIRLLDMGVEQFLVSSSLIGVMAQRLIRVICDSCKEAYVPSKALIKKWKLEDRGKVEAYQGKGCDKCKGTGFKGRTGLYELMSVDDEVKEMITDNASLIALQNKAYEKGMITLWEDGREKVLKGITTFEEVARVCEQRVELKKETKVEEPKPYVKPSQETQIAKPVAGKVDVDTQDLQAYSSRITRWLSEK